MAPQTRQQTKAANMQPPSSSPLPKTTKAKKTANQPDGCAHERVVVIGKANLTQIPNNHPRKHVMTEEGRVKCIKHPAFVAEADRTEVWCLHCNQAIQCDKRPKEKKSYYFNWTKHVPGCKNKLIQALVDEYGVSVKEARRLGTVWLKHRRTTWVKQFPGPFREMNPLRLALTKEKGYYDLPAEYNPLVDPLDDDVSELGPPSPATSDSDESQAPSTPSGPPTPEPAQPVKRRGRKDLHLNPVEDVSMDEPSLTGSAPAYGFTGALWPGQLHYPKPPYRAAYAIFGAANTSRSLDTSSTMGAAMNCFQNGNGLGESSRAMSLKTGGFGFSAVQWDEGSY